MFIQSAAEALISRLLVSIDRGDIREWTSRLFQDDAVLYLHDVPADVCGSDEIVEQFFIPLRDELTARSVVSGTSVTASGNDATLMFARRQGSTEMYIHISNGRIDRLWCYPPGARPPAAAAAAASSSGGESGIASCCGIPEPSNGPARATKG